MFCGEEIVRVWLANAASYTNVTHIVHHLSSTLFIKNNKIIIKENVIMQERSNYPQKFVASAGLQVDNVES